MKVKALILDFCVLCGTKTAIHQHHLIPRINGGTDEPENILSLCEKHHGLFHDHSGLFHSHKKLSRKGIKKAQETGVRFGKKIERPSINYLLDKESELGKYFVIMILASYGYYVKDVICMKWKDLKDLNLPKDLFTKLYSSKPDDAALSDLIFKTISKNVGKRENAFNVYYKRFCQKYNNEIEYTLPIISNEELAKIHNLLKIRLAKHENLG